MDAGTLSIGKVFGQDRRYLVPLFQRPYVWAEDSQWEPLWEDIRNVAERLIAKRATRPHFLGAIVLEQMPQRTGQIETRLVIDGQQRLTTIQILLEAFADLARELEQERLHKALLKLTRNDDPMSDDPDDVFKVWPTNVDRELFGWVMREGSPDGVRQKLGLPAGESRAGRPVPDAYFYFHEAMLRWANPGADGLEHRLETLYGAVKDYLRLVVIDLGHDDDAQLIFETLNARGTPLLPSDLVKNHLFHQARAEGAGLDQLYERWWRPFDQDATYWREEIGRGRAKRARIDVFLQDFLTLHERDDIKIAHLYDAYRSHLEARPRENASDHLERLRSYADIYKHFDAVPSDSQEALFFARLRSVEMTTAHPFLLELFFRHGKDQVVIREVLRDIESFVVRRMVCRMTTKQYNRLLIEALKLLEAPTKDVPGAIRTYLATSDAETRTWPRDAEFRRAWLDDPVGRALPPKRIKMLLTAIEQAERAKSTKTERVSDIEDKLTIEHLLPQSWHKHWPIPAGQNPGEAGEARDRCLHTIGNLTLLTRSLNPAVSNAQWGKKREAILEHSVLKLNLRLRAHDCWDEAAIRRRGEEMFEHALTLWPGPE